MVQFHTFGSTSTPCYVPPALERSGKLTCRDRRHLSNARILGWQGISHPGLTWRYNTSQNSMTCLGYSCQIYQEFDATQPNCCLSVHRSCYTVLLDHLERTEGTMGNDSLMQRIAPFANRRGILSMQRLDPLSINGKRSASRGMFGSEYLDEEALRTGDIAATMPWIMCDPTDLPSITTSLHGYDNTTYSSNGRLRRAPPKNLPSLPGRVGVPPLLLLHKAAIMEPSPTIPAQLLTPPMSPVDGCTAHQPYFRASSQTLAPKEPSIFLSLPPHVLLNIISYLHLPSLHALSQTCSILRRYLSPESKIWPAISKSTLGFTPAFLYNQQFAEFYLHVRGNSRMENLVLLQRKRVEKVVQFIIYSPRKLCY
ncbi:hypothetical protein GGI25_000102 [Coemansia spiralis]|uniref:F-box domain-containing protein n=2 Tax=Coemansia TaxID=4863 RepID=A0A9W8L1F1_9FUNG|nr:hypothetical protein EDC05_002747 [Coemansia umbellata]KAJ2681147.1 hypothetical protein GGI25_000102 [Coemansia spiralis]